MAPSFREAREFLIQVYRRWNKDRVPQLGAALAFYTALSIAPLLVISLAVGAAVFGDKAARGEVANQIQSLIGEQVADAVQQMIKSADKPAVGTAAAILSLIMLLFSASGVFGELQQTINIIWEVEPKAGRGIWGTIRDRFFFAGDGVRHSIFVLVSLILSAVLASLTTVVPSLPESLAWLGQVLNFVVSFFVITLLFAMIFKILPDARIAWRQVWTGAVLTAFLFTIGKFAIGLYLGRSSMASAYGVAGSFVVLLVWVYYSAKPFTRRRNHQSRRRSVWGPYCSSRECEENKVKTLLPSISFANR